MLDVSDFLPLAWYVISNPQPHLYNNVNQTGCLIALSLETAMVAKFGGTTNKVGEGFGVLFLFIFVVFYAGCLDACS